MLGKSGLGHHTQRSSNQNLLRSRNRLVKERLQYVPAATVLRGIYALNIQISKEMNELLRISVTQLVMREAQESSSEIRKSFNYHFQVALNFAGLVRAKTQFAVNVELAQIGVVLGNLSRVE